MVGAAQPAFDAAVGAPARAWPRHERRQIAGGETQQRVVGVQRRDHDFADFAGRDRRAAAGPDDFQINAFVDDEARVGNALVRDQPQVGGGVRLQRGDSARREITAGRGRQRLAGHQRLVDAGHIGGALGGFFQDNFQERRCAEITVRAQVGDGLHLQFGLARSRGNHRAAERVAAGIAHRAGRREVVGKRVVRNITGAKPGRKQRARETPVVAAVGGRFVNRARRGEQIF